MVQYRCHPITRGFYILVLLIFCGVSSGYGQDNSQSPTLQQLKDKLQNIEREMNEVQDQIKALEGAKAAPAPANSTARGKCRAACRRGHSRARQAWRRHYAALWFLHSWTPAITSVRSTLTGMT